MSEAIIAKKAELVDVVAEKMKAAASCRPLKDWN